MCDGLDRITSSLNDMKKTYQDGIAALKVNQDCILDHLDLHARGALHSKWSRRFLWISNTKWSKLTREKVNAMPIVGEGLMCGDPLDEELKVYREAFETVQYTEGTVP